MRQELQEFSFRTERTYVHMYVSVAITNDTLSLSS